MTYKSDSTNYGQYDACNARDDSINNGTDCREYSTLSDHFEDLGRQSEGSNHSPLWFRLRWGQRFMKWTRLALTLNMQNRSVGAQYGDVIINVTSRYFNHLWQCHGGRQMQAKNASETLTPLRRLAYHSTTTCSAQASVYGKCILASYTDIKKDACREEFAKFSKCLTEAVSSRCRLSGLC